MVGAADAGIGYRRIIRILRGCVNMEGVGDWKRYREWGAGDRE